MNKKRVIFENEEEFDISFRFFMNVSFNDSYEIILNDAKKAGLIRKNPVEEAEEIIIIMDRILRKEEFTYPLVRKEIEIIKDAIQYLKRSHPEFKEERDDNRTGIKR